MTSLYRTCLATLIPLALLTPAASAGVIFYTSQPAFLAAVSSPAVDTFDSLPLGFISTPIYRLVGSYAYQASVSESFFFGAGSVSDVWLSTNASVATITFHSLAGGVYGAGAYLFGTGYDGNFAPAVPILLSATDSSGSYFTSTVASSTTNFVGWVSDLGLLSFTVRAGATSGEAWPTVNNLILASAPDSRTAIPEPSTLALSALGLLALVRLRPKP
jgi:hypothetical protein